MIVKNVDAPPNFNWNISPEEMISLAKQTLKEAKEKIDSILELSDDEVTFENSLLTFEYALAEAGNILTPLEFLRYVSPAKEQRDAAAQIEEMSSKFINEVWSRKDLYDVIIKLQPLLETLTGEDRKLLEKTLSKFKKNGVGLPEEKRREFLELKNKLSELEIEYQKNLNEYKFLVKATEEELDGVPSDVVKTLQKEEEYYLLPLDYPVYFPVMENAKSESLRKRMFEAFNNKGGPKNSELLKEALEIRNKIAKMLGYSNFAELNIEEKMAKTPERVFSFLDDLYNSLKEKGEAEKRDLRNLKSEVEKKPLNDTELNAWDVSYLHNLMLKNKYSVDQNVVKEYFPLEYVINQMLEVYQQILGLKFEEENNPNVWHETVKQFKVYYKKTGKYVGAFYLDLFPREGKFKHAAAFDIIHAYLRPDGFYEHPVASMVANFTPSTPDKPSLMPHREVETLFHEFGHIMHQIVTEAKYARFSGANTAWDFVEAPSQMLENWVWDKTVLKKISKHYKNDEPLPEDLIEKMLKAKLLNKAIFIIRQIFFSKIDMTYHTVEKVEDPNKLWHDIYQEITGFKPIRSTKPASGFGHIMGGYAAGYYGYLWAKVYAQDMFSKFEETSPLDEETGYKYRKIVLAPGGGADEEELVIKFLGRKPNKKAFLRSLGIEI